MKRIMFALAALLVAAPVQAQTDTLSIREIRQRLSYGQARVENLTDEIDAAREHLRITYDALDLWIQIAEGQPAPDPDPVPDPTPDPDPLPEPGQGVAFASDFGTALGSSVTALQDGGRWTTRVGNGNANEVVDASGIPGWRTPNALLATCEYSGSICVTQNVGVVVEDRVIPVPAVGQTITYGWDFHVIAPDGLTDTRTHPIEDGSSRACGFAASCANWTFTVDIAQSGQWSAWWHFDQNGQNSGNRDRIMRSAWLPRGETFRCTIAITNRGATFDAAAIITDAQGNVVDSRSATGLRWGPQGAEGLTGFQAGHNGVFENTGRDVDLYYEGSFRVEVR